MILKRYSSIVKIRQTCWRRRFCSNMHITDMQFQSKRSIGVFQFSRLNDTTDKAFDRYCPQNDDRRTTAYSFFPVGEQIPAVIRHSMKADSVDAVNHGAPDIKAITETSLMWFSRRAVVSPLISATACIDFCSVPPEWKMASCNQSIYYSAEFLLENYCYDNLSYRMEFFKSLSRNLKTKLKVESTLKCGSTLYNIVTLKVIQLKKLSLTEKLVFNLTEKYWLMK